MIALGLSVLGVGPARADEPQVSDNPPKVVNETVTPRTPQQTVERALEFIEREAVKWRRERGCATCHHGPMTVWALSEARHHLARHQEEDGAWRLQPPVGQSSPPTSESRETIALLAMLAWEPSAPPNPQEAAAARYSHEKAGEWLRDTKSTETAQALALRLLLDVRLDNPAEQVQSGIDRLLGLQNSDGGWSQIKEMPSDAYATGQSLWALSFSGIKRDRPEISRAISFLVANQREDGSWPMTCRHTPGEGATRERDLVPITYFGSAWATIGLVRSVPPVLDIAVRQKQFLDEIAGINGKFERDETSPDKPVTLLSIGWGAFDDNDLAQMVIGLAAFPQLTTLRFGSTNITDAGLAHLKSLSQLQNLSLESTAITDAGLAHLKDLTYLETLNLKDTKVTDAGVQEFQTAMPKVKVER